jgi:hypothetical protein
MCVPPTPVEVRLPEQAHVMANNYIISCGNF